MLSVLFVVNGYISTKHKFQPLFIMTYKKGKFSFLSLVLFLLSINSVLAVEIKTTIDRNPININESFQIIFTATESPDDDPDFSPLVSNFEILNQTHRSNSSWINGQSTKSIQWIVNVMAKRVGKLKIPAIAFGDDFSLPATVTIKKSAIKNTGKTDELYIEVEVSSETPYVQSQVLYTLRLYRRVQISQASLNEPELDNAVIEKMGEDKNYNTDVNGIPYVITERKYAIFPQKSGVTTIKPLVLTAEVVSNTRPRFNGFFNRPATKTRRVTSKAVTLNVLAAPESFSGKQWIPAEHLYLEQKWSGDTSKMKVGEPLTRTLTILAKGTTVSQLPELHSDININQLKTYPDQPILKEKKQVDGIIAFREEKIAYIPSKSGNYTLPAIEIPWFNTQTKKMEIARIPEQTITATGSASSLANPAVTDATIQVDAVKPTTVVQIVENKLWMWISFFLSIGWLITVVFFLSKLKPKQQEQPVIIKELQLSDTVKALKQACTENNQSAAKDALLAWGKIKYNDTNLSTIASHCEARLRDEIHLLNQNLYANQSEPWQGKKLFQTFTENSARAKVAKKTNSALEPLYKT